MSAAEAAARRATPDRPRGARPERPATVPEDRPWVPPVARLGDRLVSGLSRLAALAAAEAGGDGPVGPRLVVVAGPPGSQLDAVTEHVAALYRRAGLVGAEPVRVEAEAFAQALRSSRFDEIAPVLIVDPADGADEVPKRLARLLTAGPRLVVAAVRDRAAAAPVIAAAGGSHRARLVELSDPVGPALVDLAVEQAADAGLWLPGPLRDRLAVHLDRAHRAWGLGGYEALDRALGDIAAAVAVRGAATDDRGRRRVLAPDVPAVTGDRDGLADAFDALGRHPGLGPAREHLEAVVADHWRRVDGGAGPAAAPHLVLAGEPGSGRTTVAGLVAEVLHAGRVVACDATVTVAVEELLGCCSTGAGDRFRAAARAARGGVLVLDDLDRLADLHDASQLRLALGALAAELARPGPATAVVATGTGSGADTLRVLVASPALRARFGPPLRLAAPAGAALGDALVAAAAAAGYRVTPAAVAAAQAILERRAATVPAGFGHCAALVDEAVTRHHRRGGGATLTVDDITGPAPTEAGGTDAPGPRPAPEPPAPEPVRGLAEDRVRLHRHDQERHALGLPRLDRTPHLVFEGPPGSGKTTAARWAARRWADAGLLTSGHLVEVSRGDLVAEFLGQTAPRVREVWARARGGVLFVDEAQALVAHSGWRDYGDEALSELVKLMEDDRDHTVVVFAGYEHTAAALTRANPGFFRRVEVVTFPAPTGDDLAAAFDLAASSYRFAPGARDAALQALRDRHEVGYSAVRDVLAAAVTAYCRRDGDDMALVAADFGGPAAEPPAPHRGPRSTGGYL